MDDLTVVIPAYNEDPDTVMDLADRVRALGAEVIVVDDGSTNGVIHPAIKHGTNFGYGAALMTGIRNATRPLVMTIDGDGQHAAEEVAKLYAAFKLMNTADMVIGTRRLKHEKLIRYLGRKFLNWSASLLALYWLPDLNSGCRIFKRSVAIPYFPILCRQFSFTTSITMSFMCDDLRVEWFPINVRDRSHGKSHVNVIKDGLVTLYYILRIGLALRTRKARAWLRSFRYSR